MFVPDKRKEGNGAKREGRMFQILTVLYDEKFHNTSDDDQPFGLTSTQIAHMLGLAPSWYVRDILAEMAANKWISGWTRDKANGACAYVWAINADVEYSEKWHDAFVAWYEVLQVGLPGWSRE